MSKQNEQEWWDKTWKPFTQHVRAWPRDEITSQDCVRTPETVKPLSKIKRYFKRRKFRKQVKKSMNKLKGLNAVNAFLHRKI